MISVPSLLRYASVVLAAALLLSGCGGKAPPCAICYEDEWSREPFPGQAKQHIQPLTPEDVKDGSIPHGTREFLGETALENAHPY